MEESKKGRLTDDDSYDYDDSIKNNNLNINKEPSPFAPSDFSIVGINTSLSSHRNSIILREKVIIVGDKTMGKTSIVRSFISHQNMDGVTRSIGNCEDYQMMAGVEWNVKQIPISKNNSNVENMTMNITVDLFLFDVGGQSIFNKRGLSTRFYKDCSYIICVFDICSRKTLKSCDTWIQAVQFLQGEQEVVLIGNKVDLREDHDYIVEVDDKEAMQFAKERDLSYFKCCASRPSTVEAPFMYIATQAISRYQEN